MPITGTLPPYFLCEHSGHVTCLRSGRDLLGLEPMMVEETAVLTDSVGRLMAWHGREPADGVLVLDGEPGSALPLLTALGLPIWSAGDGDMEEFQRAQASWCREP
jgi:hypothetical protein